MNPYLVMVSRVQCELGEIKKKLREYNLAGKRVRKLRMICILIA